MANIIKLNSNKALYHEFGKDQQKIILFEQIVLNKVKSVFHFYESYKKINFGIKLLKMIIG